MRWTRGNRQVKQTRGRAREGGSGEALTELTHELKKAEDLSLQ